MKLWRPKNTFEDLMLGAVVLFVSAVLGYMAAILITN